MNARDKYDKAVIKQIISSGYNIADRIMEVLIPGAGDHITSGNAPPGGVEEAREVAQELVLHMFYNEEVTCPRCHALGQTQASQYCIGRGCPILGDLAVKGKGGNW